jgi:hypothetical protein
MLSFLRNSFYPPDPGGADKKPSGMVGYSIHAMAGMQQGRL